MRVTGISAGTFGQTDGRAQQDALVPEPRPESRALVVVAPQAASDDRIADRPMAYRDASFLAHLIATKEQLPQTRTRRRAGPEEANAAYRAIAKLGA